MSTADWHQLFDRYYRKCDLYDMPWTGVNIAASKVAGAAFGGPIALVRDSHASGGGGLSDVDSSGKPKIRLFTSAGALLATVPWELSVGIVAMSWTAKEQLVVVAEDGTVVMYSVHGEKMQTFSALPAAVKADGVAEVDFWPHGLVVRTGLKSELWAITNWVDPRPQRLADAGLQTPPTSMVVLATEEKCEVLLATAAGSIIVVDASQAQDQLLNSGPFARLALSPSGSLLAAFNDDGTLHLMSTDFKSCLSKFATGSKLAPSQLLWCGEEAILLAWPNMLLLVGLLGDFVKFSMDGQPFALIPEFDGVRIITNNKCEWLARVSEATESIFKNGAVTPASQLYDAQEAFENGNAKADDNLRALIHGGDGSSSSSSSSTLKGAIDACLTAAAHEFDYEIQRSLLRAASFGKLGCASYKSDKFVDMCRVLRVLNAVRHPSVGMPLTYTQYVRLEGEVLVDRLVNRHAHLLAMRICEYLRIHPERVLVHWACQKIKTCDELSDNVLGELIVKKLQALCPGISFSHIASTAFRHGRRALATLLLEFEPLASDQVPLLMSMKEDELALNKAIGSGDTDLVYLALLHLKKHRKQKDFFALIKDKPLARDLYITYCKQSDLPGLKSFYYHLQKPQEAADVAVLEAYQCEEYSDRVAGLQVALEFYEKDKNFPFAARATEEEITLLKIEREQEVKTAAVGCVDLSVTQLMDKYIVAGDSARVAQLKTALKVGDKRMWHIEVCSLSRAGCWDELARLVGGHPNPNASAKSQKGLINPPIGFHPFIEACIQWGNLSEAAKYIARLPEYHEQMEWLCNIGYWNEAVDIAGRERDSDALLLLRERCRQPMVQNKIEKLLALINQPQK